jgi:hypothetical protein
LGWAAIRYPHGAAEVPMSSVSTATCPARSSRSLSRNITTHGGISAMTFSAMRRDKKVKYVHSRSATKKGSSDLANERTPSHGFRTSCTADFGRDVVKESLTALTINSILGVFRANVQITCALLLPRSMRLSARNPNPPASIGGPPFAGHACRQP